MVGIKSALLLIRLLLEEMLHVSCAMNNANNLEPAGYLFVEDDVVFK